MERIYDNSCRKIGCAEFEMRDGKTFSVIYNELKSLGYDVEYEKEPLEDGFLVKMKITWRFQERKKFLSFLFARE